MKANKVKNKCKRCGQCCEDVMLSRSPKELKDDYKLWFDNKSGYTEQIYLIYPMLTYKSYNKKTKRWHYKCKHSQYKNKLSSCGIQDNKPKMCSGFPHYDNRQFKMNLDRRNQVNIRGAVLMKNKKCKENWKKPPYTSDHLWLSDGSVHNNPTVCKYCGMKHSVYKDKVIQKVTEFTKKLKGIIKETWSP